MTISLNKCVGLDVSKDKLDVAIWGEKNCLEAENSKRGIAELVKQILALEPKLMVVDAITACMRKMLTILHAMMRDQQPFRDSAVAVVLILPTKTQQLP